MSSRLLVTLLGFTVGAQICTVVLHQHRGHQRDLQIRELQTLICRLADRQHQHRIPAHYSTPEQGK